MEQLLLTNRLCEMQTQVQGNGKCFISCVGTCVCVCVIVVHTSVCLRVRVRVRVRFRFRSCESAF